ncbi:MAG: hypothetical protein JXQ90_00460 [Cyclobacteriaceae bacterium]
MILVLVGTSFPLLAQESIVKDFAEGNHKNKYCFYPSTLRMVNLKNNPDYNELVGTIDKLLVYNLDSAASIGFRSIIEEAETKGFEEYITFFGGSQTLYLYGKEGNKPQMIGVLRDKESSYAFYMKGAIQFQKIPTLFSTLQENDLLNIFDLNLQGWD